MTKRLEELKAAGKEAIGIKKEGFDTPWVKWGDNPNWVEGKCQKFFDCKYGLCVEMLVTTCDDESELKAAGTNENGEDYTVTVKGGSIVNLGLYSATLAGKITTNDVDKSFYIGFEGWEISKKDKRRFRMYAVVPNPVGKVPDAEVIKKVKEVLDAEVVNDDLPF